MSDEILNKRLAQIKEGEKTVGQVAVQEWIKEPDSPYLLDYVNEYCKDYMPQFEECAELGKKRFKGDFFVVGLLHREKVLGNVIRRRFYAFETCPRPAYDQTVFKYYRKEERLEYLWTVPDPDTCDHFVFHALEIVPEEHCMLDMILDFRDGTLDKKSRELNGEDEFGRLKKERIIH